MNDYVRKLYWTADQTNHQMTITWNCNPSKFTEYYRLTKLEINDFCYLFRKTFQFK